MSLETFDEDFDGVSNQPTVGVETPPMASYDVDQLNYLRDITEDKYYERILAFIDSPSTIFSEKTKDELRLLIFTFLEPIDYALTNVRSDKELKRFYNNYRMARKRLKCSIRQRDNTSTLAQLLDHIESHLQLRLSRAKAGFERMEQTSVRQHQNQLADFRQTQQMTGERSYGISDIFRGKPQQ